MQQTTKYKLDLIEKDDVFSPDALNENTQEVEKQLSRLDSADAALDARVTALEVHKIAVGLYTGTGVETTVELPFTPVAVFHYDKNGDYNNSLLAITDSPAISSSAIELRIIPGGFIIGSESHNAHNRRGTLYNYIALA